MKQVSAALTTEVQNVLFPGVVPAGWVAKLFQADVELEVLAFSTAPTSFTFDYQALPGMYSVKVMRMDTNNNTIGAPAVANFTIAGGSNEMGAVEVPVSITITLTDI